jgi:hypothetical protein
MVNPTGNAGYQQFATQPAIVSEPDPPVREHTVQPPKAPAADTQRADNNARPPPPPPPPPESSRGKSVDVSA